MKNFLIPVFLFLWLSTSFSMPLEEIYTLSDDDYELVGNGYYNNFDIRQTGKEADEYVILQKIDHILSTHFEVIEGSAITVYFKVYDGSATSTQNWKMYVENSKFRTSELYLSAKYSNLGGESTLDVATWNIEHFPKHANSTSRVKQLIIDSKLDVIGLQEIGDDADEFRVLLSDLGESYDGFISNPDESTYDQNLAVIYKKDEITLVTQGRIIPYLEDQISIRTPIEIVFKHNSGVEFAFVVIHLKCCNNYEDRRRIASENIKEYIDETYKSSDTNVIVAGDWNDRIDSDETDLVFSNFMNDSDNYTFVDSDVSEATKDGPGWANIDHILINKPLFNIYDKPAEKLKGSSFDYDYSSFVSDHFPVWVNLNPELLSNEVNYIFKSKLNVYPNPSSDDIININLPKGVKKGTIVIMDISGREVFNEEVKENRIDISKLSKGTYIFTITSNDKLFTGKFVRS